MTTGTSTGTSLHDQAQALFRPWGVVDPKFWVGAEHEGAAVFPAAAPAPAAVHAAAAAVSGDVADRLAAIQAVASVDLVRAHGLAERLDAETTAARSEGHIETVRVRELRAHLALLTGDHEIALGWYLHVVRLHTALHGPQHSETVLAVRRAYSLWKALPARDAVRLAGDLVAACTAVRGVGEEAVRRVREDLRQLQV
ncbi:hypothetical protein ACFWCB_29910 [Streptomyces sp. NPDC060048]|uniref:hypothetical protein n=1 Tax=unclassified Streptomyces TaxID=2593676 RepID=UPI0036C8A550